MKLSRRLSRAIASFLFVANAVAFAAAPKVEETVIGPTNAGGLYTLAPSGGHVAYLGKKGQRFFISADGVEGPLLDEVIKAAGGAAFFPEKAGVWPGTLGGLEGHDAPVLYSLDGTHYAYAGRQDADYVVIYDGKEIGRGPWELTGRRGLTMSPGGKHVYWTESKMEQGRTIVRTVMNGKPGPWTFGTVAVVFSADDSRYACLIPQTRDTGKPVLIVDDKDAGYVGQSPVFTADGKLLLTISHDGGTTAVLANGKPVYKSPSIDKIFVAPSGSRWAAIAGRPGTNGLALKLLVVDGKEVPASDDVQDVWFSPDGKRYAAMCQNPINYQSAMIVDGKRHDFTRIDAQPPYWTPDSSKIIYSAGMSQESVLVVNDDVHPYTGGLSGVFMPEQGDRVSWATADNGRRDYSVVVAEKSVLPKGVYPMSAFVFSPDGSRYGYLVGPVGRGEMTGVVIDGAVQTGLAPGLIGRWITGGINAVQPPHLVFSPDSQHVAFIARAGTKRTNDLYLDDKVVASASRAVYLPQFTPDGKHFYWIADELSQPPAPTTAVYVDGELAVRANGYFFQQLPGSVHMESDGALTFLAADGDVVKRYRIAPPGDTSVATLLERGAAVATVAASTTPKPAVASAVPTPLPVKTVAAKPVPPIAASTTASATAGAALTWNDLVRRPETRPGSCTVKRDYKFQGGVVVGNGTKVNTLGFKPAGMTVGTADGRTNFDVKPEETDVVAAANAAWAQLTPAQRELTYPALLQRQELWPYRVKLALPFKIDGRKLNVGDPVILLKAEGNDLLVRLDDSNVAFNVAPQETDLMTQARAFLADEQGAPGRVLEEFAGKLISPLDGRPVSIDAAARPKYVVLYMGASWCAPCQAFSPQLVKVLKDKAPKPEDVTAIYLSGDKTPADMKAYVTKLGIDWPTIRYNNAGQLPAFSPLFGNVIPQLVVTDRFGKVVIDSSKTGYDKALTQLRDLL